MTPQARTWMRDLREHLGDTQIDAAVRVGVSATTWQRWEQGVQCPRRELWRDIADVLRVPAGDIRELLRAEGTGRG